MPKQRERSGSGWSAAVYEVERSRRSHDLDREARWHENWQSWDFSWHGRSETAYLKSSRVEVPASFPDGALAKGHTKFVSLKDYWRWSLGSPGKERLLTDEELLAAGLLVEVDGEWFHLIHAPDIDLKRDSDGEALPVLQAIIGARAELKLPASGRDEHRTSRSHTIPFMGGWLPGSILRLAGPNSDLRLDFCRLFEADLSGEVIGRLWCFCCMFSGHANLSRTKILDEANFESSVFMGTSDFFETTFNKKALLGAVAFVEAVTFRNATFSAKVDFCGVAFHAFADIENVNFGGEAHFDHATFCGGASFRESVFQGTIFFFGACFQKEARFDRITQTMPSRFPEHVANQDVRVGSATFVSPAKFDLNAFVWTTFTERRI